ncbi:MAG: AAA family ATPase [Tannerella sp.]|jgi:ATP-dependent exoDNAse (exonuclease V) alpha subunit|nr:AAA family ATPase [Tannerella sp.]
MTENTTFEFTPSQKRALDSIHDFILSLYDKVFIIRGYAGTGKTTLVKEIIRMLQDKELTFSLMASTGRAAKILSNVTGCKATTVHSAIYNYKDFNLNLESVAAELEKHKKDNSGMLFLLFELNILPEAKEKRFYIIDEASMIGDKEDKNISQAFFGSGKLLNDLLKFDPNGKFIFVGDECQLPPINEVISPALSAEYFQKKYAIPAKFVQLTEIVRQENTNDIIVSSQKIRKLYANPPIVKWAKFPLKNYRNIKIFTDQASMLNDYVKRIKKEGYNTATYICRSNKLCDGITTLIRPALGLSHPKMQKGDLLLITQNNLISGLMNGDLVEVISIGSLQNRAQLSFVQVELKELFTQKVYSQLMIEQVLYNNQINLTPEQQKELFMDYYSRMRRLGFNQKDREFKERLRTDIYLNALRAVFGFALTCHKSQGGEWEHVYLDIPRNLPLNPTSETYQWLYTAVTRAKTQLYITDGFWL